MRVRNLTVALLLLVTVLANARRVEAQDEPTAEEKQEAERVAKQFTDRLGETKDIAPLIQEFFAPDFLDRIPPNLCAENVAASICPQISRGERLRSYVATFNRLYFSTLDVLSRPAPSEAAEGTAERRPAKPFEGMLPPEVAAKLRRTPLIGKVQRVETVEQFREQLTLLEQALTEAQDHLLRHPLEALPQYQERIAAIKHARFIVRVWTARHVREEYFDTGLLPNERLFPVRTPLNLDLLLMRDGGGLKVLTVMPGDDY